MPRRSDRTVKGCLVQMGVLGLYHAKYISRAVIVKQFFFFRFSCETVVMCGADHITEEEDLLLDHCTQEKDKHAVVWSQCKDRYLAYM